MNSIRIQTDQRRHLIYFFDSNEYPEKESINLQSMSIEEKHQHGGLSYYRNFSPDDSFSSQFYTLFASALSLLFNTSIDLVGADNTPYNVSKKELDNWIWKCLGKAPSGNYYEDIKSICNKNIYRKENNANKSSKSIIFLNPKLSNHNSLKLTENLNPNFQIIPGAVCNPPLNTGGSPSPELLENFLDHKHIPQKYIREDNSDIFHFSIKINEISIPISAKSILMSSSGSYFSRFFEFGVDKELNLNDYQFDSSLDNPEKQKNAVFVLKKYFERDFEDSNTNQSFQIGSEDLLALISFHQIFDISGILKSALQSLDFYSNELILWKGEKITRLAFYKVLKNVYPKEPFIDISPRHQILDSIIQQFKKNLNKSTFCDLSFLFHKDESLNLIFKLKENAHLQKNLYSLLFFPFSNLTLEQLQELNISSVTIDLKELNFNSSEKSFFLNLLLNVKDHLSFLKNIEVSIVGAPYEYFERKASLPFCELLKGLFAYSNKVTFSQIRVGMIYEESSEPLNEWKKTLSNLFHSLAIEGYSTAALYTFFSNAVIFSATLTPSTHSERQIEASYSGDEFNISSHFSLINIPFHLILNQNTLRLKAWSVINLQKLEYINRLTVKNAKINEQFYIILRSLNLNMKIKERYFYCDLANCEVDKKISNELEQLITLNNKEYEKFKIRSLD